MAMYKKKGSEGRGRKEMVYPLEMILFHARHTVSSSLLFKDPVWLCHLQSALLDVMGRV